MKIAYFFTDGRKERLLQEKKGEEIPYEFFFGATGLEKYGHEISIFEIADFEQEQKTKNKLKYNFTSISSCGNLLCKNKIKQLNNYDLIIAGNEYIAFGISDFIQKNILKIPFVFFAMGMLSQIELLNTKKQNLKTFIKFKFGKYLYKKLVKNAQVAIFVGKGEAAIAKNIFKKHEQKIRFLLFPVDDNFWKPLKETKNNYVLFMGNDLRRDFDLTLRIARNMPNSDFVFVSKRFNKQEIPKNVKLIKGDWKEKQLSDAQVRQIINDANIVILPLKETFQPSGQSVAQQAMACKTPVIITKTKGFWDKQKIINGKHIIIVENNNIKNWISAIDLINLDYKLHNKISKNANVLIKKYYNLNSFETKLSEILNYI